jgi:cysteine-rich repeat protein
MHKGGKRYISRNKKGLSTVVANLLLILLVIVAVGIIWVVIRNIVSQGAEQISLGQFTIDLSITSAYVQGTNIIVGVSRSSGDGQVTGINFVFLNSSQSITIRRNIALNPLETRIFIFSQSEVPGIAEGDKVSVAPIYISSGSEKNGSVTDTKKIGTPPPGAEGGTGGTGSNPVCGNGVVETGETCDDGNTVSGDGCSATCQVETGESETGYCGDSMIQYPNSNGDYELCDTNNLNGQTCAGLGFGGGTLTCDVTCQFDTSQCTEIPPQSCDGTWSPPEDPNVECELNVEPKCTSNCLCSTGFSPRNDGSGTCILNPPLITGIIYTVWNGIFIDSQDLPKDSVSMSAFQNKYVNFSNSAETGCFLITFADYIQPNDISYLRLDDSFGVPNVNSGESFSVWEAPNCGQ